MTPKRSSWLIEFIKPVLFLKDLKRMRQDVVATGQAGLRKRKRINRYQVFTRRRSLHSEPKSWEETSLWFTTVRHALCVCFVFPFFKKSKKTKQQKKQQTSNVDVVFKREEKTNQTGCPHFWQSAAGVGVKGCDVPLWAASRSCDVFSCVTHRRHLLSVANHPVKCASVFVLGRNLSKNSGPKGLCLFVDYGVSLCDNCVCLVSCFCSSCLQTGHYYFSTCVPLLLPFLKLQITISWQNDTDRKTQAFWGQSGECRVQETADAAGIRSTNWGLKSQR